MECPDVLGTLPRDQSPLARMMRARGDWRFCPRRYTLSQDQILKAAPAAVDAGVDAIVLQSGKYTLATTESR